MQPQGRTRADESRDDILARIANVSHGVVTRAELLDAGMSPTQIRVRLERGSLLQEYRGVYRVGHRAPSLEARYLAAVRAGGAGALLRGTAAAKLLSLVKGAAPPPQVMSRTERRVPGVVTLRSRGLDRLDGAVWRGVPVTSVARTLVDLAAVLDPASLARACHEAGVLHGTTPSQVHAVMARLSARPGAASLRAVLDGDVQVTLSQLEGAFVALLTVEGFELPTMNRPAGGRRVDCRWPRRKLTVELDGYRFHSSRHAWELDRRREREARARGDEFRRYTYGDVLEDPRLMLAEIRELLPRAAS